MTASGPLLLDANIRAKLKKIGQHVIAAPIEQSIPEGARPLIPRSSPVPSHLSEDVILQAAQNRLLAQFETGKAGDIAFRMVQKKQMSPEAAKKWMLDLLMSETVWKPHQVARPH